MRTAWASWQREHPEPYDVHVRPGPRFRPVAVRIGIDGTTLGSSGWGVSVTDGGMLLRRPFLGRSPGLWIPWEVVEHVESKSGTIGAPGQALDWAQFTLVNGRGELAIADPAGDAAHGHWRLAKSRRLAR